MSAFLLSCFRRDSWWFSWLVLLCLIVLHMCVFMLHPCRICSFLKSRKISSHSCPFICLEQHSSTVRDRILKKNQKSKTNIAWFLHKDCTCMTVQKANIKLLKTSTNQNNTGDLVNDLQRTGTTVTKVTIVNSWLPAPAKWSRISDHFSTTWTPPFGARWG